QLLPAERASIAARPTRNAEAYDHYLRGQRAANTASPANVGAAIRELEEAVRLDTAFSVARASLSLAYASAVNWAWAAPGMRESDVLARAVATSERALRESPASSAAWVAR